MRPSARDGHWFGCVAVLVGLTTAAKPACGDAEARRLLIVCVPGLRSEDILHPRSVALRKMAERAAVGWMNTRTARIFGQRRDPPEAVYASLAAGARATAGPWARRPGLAVLERLSRVNSQLDHRVSIGALGRAVLASGGSTDVVGNEDDTTLRRGALLLAMDPLGRVSRDASGATIVRSAEATSPYGVSQRIEGFTVPWATLTVWVYGDLARADRYAALCTPRTAIAHRESVLAHLDAFLERRVMPLLGDTDLAVALIAPGPADSRPATDRLAPVLWASAGASRGLLTSPSTRTAGLVTVTDFLPTALQYLRLSAPPGLIGRPWYAVRDEAVGANAGARWASLHERWFGLSERQRAFGGVPGLQASLALVGFLLVWRGGSPRLVRACALALLAMPAFHLLAPLAPLGAGRLPWVALLICLCALAVTGAFGATAVVRAVGVACAAIIAAVVPADLSLGGSLLRGAWMSYSVMEGARYYGIGNEFAGAWLGCGTVAVAASAPPAPAAGRATLAVWALLTVFLIGSSGHGANVGAFAGAAAGMGACAVVLLRAAGRGKGGLAVLCAAVALTAAIGALDVLASPQSQSHFARALLQAPEVPMLIARKVQMNAYLMLHSVWTLALLAGLLWYGAVRARTEGHLSLGDRLRRAGLLAGGGAMLALNDSGVVAAALTVLPIAAAAAIWLPETSARPDA